MIPNHSLPEAGENFGGNAGNVVIIGRLRLRIGSVAAAVRAAQTKLWFLEKMISQQPTLN